HSLRKTPAPRTGHHRRHGGPSVRAGQPYRGVTRLTPNRERQTDRQTERKIKMNGCRQEALTIPTAREHAATPRSQHTTHTEQAITQRATRGSGSSSIHNAAPHSMQSQRGAPFPP
ncbi:hypothetical protein TcCL_Unassigned05342, partial [Trypanosoma cruzi]